MKPTPNEIRVAQEAVDKFNEGDLLGHNTKYLSDGETIQIRIGSDVRVQFKIQEEGEKEIIDIFIKSNHISSDR